jgi:ABC-type sugar transport system substrate-binding protein
VKLFKRRTGFRRGTVGVVLGSMVLGSSLIALGASTAGADSSGNTVPAAVTLLKQYEARPQHIQVTKAIGKAIPTGKTLDWVVCGSPLCTVLTPPLQAAAEVLGWKVVAIPGGLTPETILDAWNQAVANHPDAVMGSGFPSEVFQPAIDKLNAEGAVVINGFTTDTVGNGVKAEIVSQPSEYKDQGKGYAAYTVGTLGKSLNSLFVYGSTFQADKYLKAGYEAEQKKLCPSCGFTALNVPESDVGSTLPSVITAYLNSHPQINFLVLGEGSFETGIPQALQTAGLASKVKVISQYPTQSSVQDLSAGKTAALVTVEQSDTMWLYVDALARIFTHQSPTPSEASSPVWVVTSKTVNQLTAPYHVVPNYQAQFKKLWGK